MNTNYRGVGGYYERKAADYLKKQGLEILEHNFRCRQGEIDLIARDGEYIVFVEVKYRSSKYSGVSLSAVNKKKQRIISRVALVYLWKCVGETDCPCRFDVVGIDGEEVHWVKNAFAYITG